MNWALRFNELDESLPSTKTHIGFADNSVAKARTSYTDLLDNGPFPSSGSISEAVYTYTPPAGVQSASFSLYNYGGAVDYEVESVQILPSVENIENRLSLSEARIITEEQTRANADGAQVSRLNSLESSVDAPSTGLLARMLSAENLETTNNQARITDIEEQRVSFEGYAALRGPEDFTDNKLWTASQDGFPDATGSFDASKFINSSSNGGGFGPCFRNTQSSTIYEKRIIPFDVNSPPQINALGYRVSAATNGEDVQQLMALALDQNGNTIGGRLFLAGYDAEARHLDTDPLGGFTLSARMTVADMQGIEIARPSVKYLRLGCETLRGSTDGEVELRAWSVTSNSLVADMREVQSDAVQIENRVTTVEANKAETSALNSAESRITNNEGQISGINGSITSLQSTKADAVALTAESQRTDQLAARIDFSALSAGQILPNWNFFDLGEDGKPSGIVPVENTIGKSQILRNASGNLVILGGPDLTVAFGFPAIPIDDKLEYKIIVRHKSSAATVSGLYLRMNEYNGALPSGKTHVAQVNNEWAVARTGLRDLQSPTNGPMPGTTLIESTFDYVPNPNVKFASFSMYNWADGVDYEVESVQIVPSSQALDNRITSNQSSILQNTLALSTETTARVQAIEELLAKTAILDTTAFDDNDKWTVTASGSPSVVTSFNPNEFETNATYGPVLRRTSSGTAYRKKCDPVYPGGSFEIEFLSFVETLPPDGDVLQTMVGIALDGNYNQVGSRYFPPTSVPSSQTGFNRQSASVLMDDILAARPGAVMIRWGAEFLRQESGLAYGISYSVSTGITAARQREIKDILVNDDGSYARFLRQLNAGNAEAFFSIDAKDVNGNSFTTVAFGADRYDLFVPSDNDWRSALQVTGDRIRANVTLEAGAGIFVGPSNALWQVALRSEFFYETDGTVIGFGFDLGDYDVVFSTEGLDTLLAGETYVLRAINKTGTGFTADLKITTAGTPTTITENTNATSPSGPDHMVAKADSDFASNDIYKFYASGSINVIAFDEGDGFGGGGGGPVDYFGGLNVRLWFHDGTSWTDAGTFYLNYQQVGINPTHTDGSQTYTFTDKLIWSQNWTGTIRSSATLGCFGAEDDNGNGITDLTKVTYQKAESSGTRSATPNGELATIQVIPK